MRLVNVHGLQLQFDADQFTHGDSENRAFVAIDLINGVLQRQPFGLGAQLIARRGVIIVEEDDARLGQGKLDLCDLCAKKVTAGGITTPTGAFLCRSCFEH